MIPRENIGILQSYIALQVTSGQLECFALAPSTWHCRLFCLCAYLVLLGAISQLCVHVFCFHKGCECEHCFKHRGTMLWQVKAFFRWHLGQTHGLLQAVHAMQPAHGDNRIISISRKKAISSWLLR